MPLKLVFRTSVGVGNVILPGEKVADEAAVHEQRASVEGLPDGTLPTAKIGHRGQDAAGEDPDSMVDKVGKIIDDGAETAPGLGGRAGRDVDGADNTASEQSTEAGNDESIKEGGAVKDEL